MKTKDWIIWLLNSRHTWINIWIEIGFENLPMVYKKDIIPHIIIDYLRWKFILTLKWTLGIIRDEYWYTNWWIIIKLTHDLSINKDRHHMIFSILINAFYIFKTLHHNKLPFKHQLTFKQHHLITTFLWPIVWQNVVLTFRNYHMIINDFMVKSFLKHIQLSDDNKRIFLNEFTDSLLSNTSFVLNKEGKWSKVILGRYSHLITLWKYNVIFFKFNQTIIDIKNYLSKLISICTDNIIIDNLIYNFNQTLHTNFTKEVVGIFTLTSNYLDYKYFVIKVLQQHFPNIIIYIGKTFKCILLIRHDLRKNKNYIIDFYHRIVIWWILDVWRAFYIDFDKYVVERMYKVNIGWCTFYDLLLSIEFVSKGCLKIIHKIILIHHYLPLIAQRLSLKQKKYFKDILQNTLLYFNPSIIYQWYVSDVAKWSSINMLEMSIIKWYTLIHYRSCFYIKSSWYNDIQWRFYLCLYIVQFIFMYDKYRTNLTSKDPLNLKSIIYQILPILIKFKLTYEIHTIQKILSYLKFKYASIMNAWMMIFIILFKYHKKTSIYVKWIFDHAWNIKQNLIKTIQYTFIWWYLLTLPVKKLKSMSQIIKRLWSLLSSKNESMYKSLDELKAIYNVDRCRLNHWIIWLIDHLYKILLMLNKIDFFQPKSYIESCIILIEDMNDYLNKYTWFTTQQNHDIWSCILKCILYVSKPLF